MLSISIRYGGKLSYAMRALSPMLGSNSSQTETALSQMLGHDGARRHTLLSKMLRHNSARTQDHSNTSIGLHQRSCAAVCDMFLGKKSWKSLYHNKEHWEDPSSRPAPFCGERFRFRAIRIAAVNARNDEAP